MPLPRSSTPVGPADLTLTVSGCCPHLLNNEDTNMINFGAQSRGFSICCLRFKSCVTTTHARLASGWWLPFAGRELNPLDSTERFQSTTATSPFPRLALAL
jgi:hypothetical protein